MLPPAALYTTSRLDRKSNTIGSDTFQWRRPSLHVIARRLNVISIPSACQFSLRPESKTAYLKSDKDDSIAEIESWKKFPAKLFGSSQRPEGQRLLAVPTQWSRIKRQVIASSSIGAGFYGAFRFTVTATNTCITAADYKLNWDSGQSGSQKCQEVHRRAAARLLRVCKLHGGIYTKLGQYISTMNHILPEHFTTTLSELTDRAPNLPWTEISKVLKEDFPDLSLDDVFSVIDERPMAAASLAQVHRAVRKKDGLEVALKLQYPHLRAQTRGDMWTLKKLVRFIGWLFPEYEFTWLFPEFEQNISHELDFRQEAFNGERTAMLFARRKDVHVPRIDWQTTSARCLTMEFIRGTKVTDREGLERMGFKRKYVAQLVCHVFAEMLHVHGFIHCDPHPGNLLIRKHPDHNTMQLVLLDHGMYRRLEPDVRIEYNNLWRAFLTQDTALGKETCLKLGIQPSSLQILSLVFTARTTNSKHTRLGDAKLDPRDREALKADIKDVNLSDVNKFLYGLSRDILWIFRSTNIVRSLNAHLGGTTKLRLRIIGSNVIKGQNLDVTTPTPPEEVSQLANLILDSWILHNLPSIDPNLLDDETVFAQWWTASGPAKMTKDDINAKNDDSVVETGVLGPLARIKLKARVSQLLETQNSHVSAPLICQPLRDDNFANGCLPPPVCEHELKDLDRILDEKSSLHVDTKKRLKWFKLPGAATLNLPVCSEIIRWKHAGRCRHYKSVSWISRIYCQIVAALDRFIFNTKLWGIDLIWIFVEQQVDGLVESIFPPVRLEE